MTMSLYFNQQIPAGPTPLQERALREAYLMLYAFVGAKKEDHFIFTSSGAEAINHAVFAAYVDVTRKTGKNHFLCSALDEAPAIMAMGRLQEMGCVFQMVPPCPQGYVTLRSVIEMLTPRTAMLSLSAANGLTGVVQPLSEISALCQDRGILFHVDATHILGKSSFSFHDSGADLMSFNGPSPGMGALLVRAGFEVSPFILGGKEQGQMRGGALNVTFLLEFAKWAKEERSRSDYYGLEIARLRQLFEEKICLGIPGTKVLFQEEMRAPHITSLSFPGIESESLCFALTQKGLHATFGGNTLQHLVHILKACSVPAPECHSGVSFAFAPTLTEEDVEIGAQRVIEIAKHLQKYSRDLMNEGV
jgi:cysteine desulfurase